MKHQPTLLLTLTVALAAGAAAAEPVDLATALAAARANAVELAIPAAERQAAAADAAAVAAAYDVILFADAQWAQDRSEQSSIFAGDRRDRSGVGLGVRKLFPSATLLEAKIAYQRDRTAFPAAGTAALDVSQFLAFNPAYQTTLELRVAQPLWRNWAGRELKLQQQLADTGVVSPQLQQRLEAQVVQAQTEQMYWTLAALEAQIDLARELIAKTRQFALLMERRTQFGRADQVDVASAQALLVAREGALLNLEVAAEDLRRRLRIRLDPAAPPATGETPRLVDPAVLMQPKSPLPAATRDEALAYALENRIDLQLLEAGRTPLRLQAQLVEERTKPDVRLFGQVGSNGLEGVGLEALTDSVDDGRHISYAVGIAAEFNLERTEYSAAQAALAARQATIDARRQAILVDIKREIELAYAQMEAAKRKRMQAERAVASLTAKRDAEAAKFRQARSEEIAVLSFDLEALAARSDLIVAHQAEAEAGARLRLALHAYPQP